MYIGTDLAVVCVCVCVFVCVCVCWFCRALNRSAAGSSADVYVVRCRRQFLRVLRGSRKKRVKLARLLLESPYRTAVVYPPAS
jgi:hypothetical protein